MDMYEFLDEMNEIYLEINEKDEETLDMLDATIHSVGIQLGWDLIRTDGLGL